MESWVGLNHWAQVRPGRPGQTTVVPVPGVRRQAPARSVPGDPAREAATATTCSRRRSPSWKRTGVDGRAGRPARGRRPHRALQRLGFLGSVGLGYLHMNRLTWTLSAGEAQRIKLASVLGGGLVGMTVLLDEPSRGLHPSEVDALARTLIELRDAGNTVIAVEHDATPHPRRRRRHRDRPRPRTGRRPARRPRQRRVGHPGRARRTRLDPSPRRAATPTGWMHVTGARENNLRGLDVRIPLGVQVGVCGVSGSGKSSLVVDTIALGLARPKTNVPGGGIIRVEPGAHDAISGAPARTVVADQSRAEITSPGMFLGLIDAVRKAFAASEVAREQGITIKDLSYGCDACNGKGTWQQGMSFLPSVTQTCDACGGIRLPPRGRRPASSGTARSPTSKPSPSPSSSTSGATSTPYVASATPPLALGLGYLVVRQPGWSLSGGEAQRLKLAKELARRTKAGSPLRARRAHRRPAGHRRRRARSAPSTRSSTPATPCFVVEHDPMLLADLRLAHRARPGRRTRRRQDHLRGPTREMLKADTPIGAVPARGRCHEQRCCSATRRRRCGGEPPSSSRAPTTTTTTSGLARRDRAEPRRSVRSSHGSAAAETGPKLAGLPALPARVPRLPRPRAHRSRGRQDLRPPAARRLVAAAARRHARTGHGKPIGRARGFITMQTVVPLRGIAAAGLRHRSPRRTRLRMAPRRTPPRRLLARRPQGRPRRSMAGPPAGDRTTATHPRRSAAARRRPALSPASHCTPHAAGPTPPASASTTSSPARPATQSTLGWEVSRLVGLERAMGQVTFYVTFDLGFLLDLASRCGVSPDDRRVHDLVDYLETLRGPYGLWQHPTHPQLSRWLTFDLESSLRRLARRRLDRQRRARQLHPLPARPATILTGTELTEMARHHVAAIS